MNRPGDMAELNRLVGEHLQDALRLATRLCGNAHTAEDLVQDALLSAARSWKRFRGECSFSTWLFRIVVNQYRDHVRRRPVGLAELPADFPDERMSGRPDLEAADLRYRIETEISKLPPRQREVLVLRVVENVPVKEVAEILQTNEANVHATLHAARRKLRERLGEYVKGC